MSTKVIVDTDIGVDDAVALAVLLKTAGERVKLILTSYGNVSVRDTTENALAFLSLTDMDIPVVRGAEKPGPGNAAYKDAAYVHGDDGLGGLRRTIKRAGSGGPPETAFEGDYLKLVYDAIVGEERVDYISLGPLTNLSALLRRFPDIAGHIGRIVTMGGGIGRGNVTPYAEFNLYCDAESAEHVFSSAHKLILTPLNITTKVFFDPPRIKDIARAGTGFARFMSALLEDNYRRCVAYGEPGSTMHDATAALTWLYPELFEFVTCGVRVECGKERYGESTLVENRGNILLTAGTEPEKLLGLIARSLV